MSALDLPVHSPIRHLLESDSHHGEFVRLKGFCALILDLERYLKDEPLKREPINESWERALEAAYAAKDWALATACLDHIILEMASDSVAIRGAESLINRARFTEALALCDRVSDPKKRDLAQALKVRALCGLGQYDDALACSQTLCVEKAPSIISALCVYLAIWAGKERATYEALRLSRSYSVTFQAFVQTLNGQNNPLRTVRRFKGLAQSGVAKKVVYDLRFHFSRCGWPSKAASRWTRFLMAGCKLGLFDPDKAALLCLETGNSATALKLDKAHKLSPQTKAEIQASPSIIDFKGLAQTFQQASKTPCLSPAECMESPHLVHICTSLAMGGSERQLQALLLQLGEHIPNLKQTLILAGRGIKGEFERELSALEGRIAFLAPEGLDRDLLPTEHDPRLLKFTDALHKQARLPRITRLSRLLRQIGAQSVMLWRLDPYALLAAHRAGVKAIMVRSGSMPIYARPYPTELQIIQADQFKTAVKVLKKQANITYVANSERALMAYRELMDWPKSHSKVLYNSLDLMRFQAGGKTAARADLGLPNKILVGGVFRLSPEKRPLLWLKTFAHYLKQQSYPDDFRGVITGDGPMRKRLEMFVEQSPILRGRVLFLGKVIDKIATAYQAFDVILHTSSVEGLPNVLIEAQSAGCPVVTTDVGGCREAVLDQTSGLVIDSAQPAHLSDALEQVLGDIEHYRARILAPEFKNWLSGRFGFTAHRADIEQALGL